jgi:hypothetical protein
VRIVSVGVRGESYPLSAHPILLGTNVVVAHR